MVLKNLEFTHDTSDIDQALHIPKEIKNAAIEKIIFSSVSNSLLGFELFDNEDDRPAELRTITGDLQKTLSLVTDQLEYEYILFKFLHYHELVKTVMALYINLNYKAKDEEAKKSAEQIKKLMVLKELLETDDEQRKNSIVSFNNMYKKVDLVKKSNYNFQKYTEYVGNTKQVDDILDILRDID